MTEETAKRLLREVRDAYDAVADEFSASRTTVWPELFRFRDRVRPGDRVLDLGCGNGRAYHAFDGVAIDYVGVDASPRMIDRAREKTGDVLATFSVADLTDLPFEDGEFDAVVSVAAFHHVPSVAFREVAFREAARVLAPGGTLMLANWARVGPKYAWRHVAAFLRKLVGASELDWRDVMVPFDAGRTSADRYYHWFSRRELRRLCEGAGLEVLHNGHVRQGKDVPWWRADNILTIARKPPDDRIGERGVWGM